MYLYEILVPTLIDRENGKGLRPIKTRYHRIWDEKVRAITKGLTILPVSKGQWVSPHGTLFIERMIPVRIMANEDDMNKIVDMTIEYYNQEAIMFYKVSSDVQIKMRTIS